MREKLLLFCSFILSSLFQPASAQPEWCALSARQGLGSDCIMDAAQDRLGRVWLATTGGLSLYDGNGIQTFTRSRTPEAGCIIANDLNKVWPDPQHPVIWIATQRDGLDAFDYRSGVFTHYQADGRPGSIVDNSVTSISPSRAGGIWLTSYMGGISHYNRLTDDFTLLNRRTLKGLVSDAMWCVLETGDSLLYTGHVRNGLSCIDLRTRRARNIPVISCFPNESPAEDGVRALVQDKRGRIWMGTEKGLACLSPQTKKPVPVPGVRGLVCHLHLAHDTLWISTRDMGLWALCLTDVRLPESGELTFRRDDALQPVTLPCFGAGETALVRCALPDRFGNLWVGTDRKGAQVRLHEPGMFRYEPEPTAVQALERDAQGRIWAGTQSDGIVVTTPEGSMMTLDVDNSGLGSNSVTALRRTPDGDSVPTQAQLCYPAETFRMNAALALPGGRILWAGDGRLTVRRSVGHTVPLPEHHVFVSRSDADGKYSATLCLPDIALTDKIRFRYRMDGGAWQEAGTERRLPLGRLAAGTHRLETCAGFIGDPRTDAPAVETLVRVPLPWSAIATWAGLLLPVLSGGLFLIRRKRRLRKKAPSDTRPDTSGTAALHTPTGTPAASRLTETAAPLAEADRRLTERAAEAVERLMQDTGLDKNRLAQELCMSPSTLYRRLKSATGMSPNEYIRHRRLLRARRLLLTGHSVSETAALVGMSITYLGRCYKEEFGISPSEVHP